MRRAVRRSNRQCCARTRPSARSLRLARRARRKSPVQSSIRSLPEYLSPLSWLFLGGLFAAGLRPLIEIGHAAIQDWRDSRIGLRPLLGLIGNHRILDETANQTFQRIVSALKLCRMMNRTGRARLTA